LKTFGFKEFSKYLDAQGRKLKDTSKLKALMRAAKVIAKRAGELAPRRRGVLGKNVKVVRYYEAESEEGFAVAITTSGRGWYGHIVELGYGRQRPQPFLRPAMAEKEQEAIKVLGDEIKKELEL
jgi:HK97 gp10 family phage protein